jgi:hypothetical protein
MRVCAALAAGLVLGLGACSDSDSGSSETQSLDAAGLEELVADSVTPDDENAAVSADCAGGIDVEVDAAQDCRVMVGEQTIDVHFVVTDVRDGEVTDAEFTPYIPGERLAPVVQQELSTQVPDLTDVQCDEELTGEQGATTECAATSGGKDVRVEVDVTKVDGLFINFHMQLVEP